MAWVPTRRQMTCGSPALTASPYSKVARPSSAHFISKMPVAPFTPLTRRPFLKLAPAAQVVHELSNRDEERGLLTRRQRVEVRAEASQPTIGRHACVSDGIAAHTASAAASVTTRTASRPERRRVGVSLAFLGGLPDRSSRQCSPRSSGLSSVAVAQQDDRDEPRAPRLREGECVAVGRARTGEGRHQRDPVRRRGAQPGLTAV